MAKKRVRRKKSSRNFKKTSVRVSKRKIRIVTINLLVFLVLTIVSWFLQAVVTSTIFINLFFLLTWIFGFIFVAFLIVFLILLVMRIMKK